jgi:hypothetical protein
VFWVFRCGWVFIGVFFLVSLVFFALSVFVSFCILSVYLGAPLFFIKIFLLIKKKIYDDSIRVYSIVMWNCGYSFVFS